MYRRTLWAAVTAALCLTVQSLPPDKMRRYHIIKARSIDIYNVYGVATETRLFSSVEPTGYKLEIEPYLEDGVFKGRVSINMTWVQDYNRIEIYAAHDIDVTATELWIQGPDSQEMMKAAIESQNLDAKRSIYTIRLNEDVRKNSTGKVDISFSGSLETVTTEGFFKTTYTDASEQESIVAATQLRPNNARRMFPCFDEPTYKAPFELSVVCPRNMVALSNTPIARTENITGEPNAVWVHFERTPPMSTFTLGLVIADLKQLGESIKYEDEYGSSIELRLWGRQEYLTALKGVDEKIHKVFSEVARYWRVPLPLRKLDVVALPNYQGVKPADNWGLIVFKESDLSNRGYLQLTQEVLYQWLGAFTTPDWWWYAHLNKGLVGFLAAKTAFQIDNGVEMEGKWPMTVLYSLYYEFGKPYPHSRITGMKQEMECTKIELLFRMFNYTLGADTFDKGIRTFLNTRKFKTFTRDDIWSSLDAAIREDGKLPKDVHIKSIAESWYFKEALPLITAERNYDTNSVIVREKLYLRERPHNVRGTDRASWWVPIVIARGDHLNFTNSTPDFWMNDSTIRRDMPSKEHFIIINPEEIAPFLVNYDKDNWNLLSEYLQKDERLKIPELTRAKLLHDAWNLAYAGELSFATALNMTLFLSKERNHLVWDPVFTMIDHIGRHIDSSEVHTKFQAYVRALLSPLYEELIQEEERADEENWRKNLRSLTQTFLCKAGYRPCIRHAQVHFRKWVEAPNPDEGNPTPNQYICPVFKWGTKKEWEFGLQRVINFPSSRKQSERTYLLKTLAGCPVDTDRIEKLLNITVLEGNGNFTETDMFLIFSMLTGNSKGYTTLFNFVNKNWDNLKEKYISKTNLWDNLISSATSRFTTQQGLELVSGLYAAHKGEFGSAKHIIETSIKNIREEAQWSAENLPVIESWLDDYLARNKLEDDDSTAEE